MFALPIGLLFPNPWTDAKRALVTALVFGSIGGTVVAFVLALIARRGRDQPAATGALAVSTFTGGIWLLIGTLLTLVALDGGFN